MIITNYDTKTKTLHSKFSGNITLEELTLYFQQLGTNRNLPDKLLYFEDHTEAEYLFKAPEIKKLARTISICVKQFKFVRAAILHSKPKETAYSIIALQHINYPHVQSMVFSTIEAANIWLYSENVLLQD